MKRGLYICCAVLGLVLISACTMTIEQAYRRGYELQMIWNEDQSEENRQAVIDAYAEAKQLGGIFATAFMDGQLDAIRHYNSQF